MSEKLSEITEEATSVGNTDRVYIVQSGVSKYIDGETLNSLYASFEYQTEITAASTTLDGTQKGLNNVYPFNSASAQTVQIDSGDYSENDVINIERRGQGTVQIVQGTDVRFRGVRNVDNEFFINDANSMVSLICRGSDEFTIIGNLTRGYTGAVTTSSYGDLDEGDTAVDVTVTGTGFSENMIVTVSANATQSSAFTYVSATEITLHLTAVGSSGDNVTVTYYNGDVFVDTDAITIGDVAPTYSDYTAWYKLDETSGTTVTDESGNYNGTNNGTTNIDNTGQVNKSYAFNGTDNYISGLGSAGITGFPFTIKMWVKNSAWSGIKHLWMDDDPFNYIGVSIYTSDLKVGIRYGDGSGTSSADRKNYITTNDVLTTSTWQQISIKFTDINTAEIKIDNSVEATTSPGGTAVSVSFTGQDYNIARSSFAGTNYDFELDDLAVWNRALTSTEQTDIYTLENAGTPML